MLRRSYAIALLLFGSGACALVYQVAWLRELRLVFGASTPASAAVLAVFMGGLGFGSLLFSKRVDRSPAPLLLYAKLEAGIALTAALSPLLLGAARAGYVAVGGTTSLGMTAGTLVRLGLSALVLLPPTLLMGGTLPAAARAATSGADTSRRGMALLYGANTLGAVGGAAATTFFLLENLGTHRTLWTGCLLNTCVAALAWMVHLLRAQAPREADEGAISADGAPDVARREAEALRPAPAQGRSARAFVLVAAGGTGFVFLQMELVWYRLLGPLLGGSSYTFGLILTLALLGIGLGGLAYTLFPPRASATAFATTCALEALFVALPFALGDRVALLAVSLRDLGVAGLGGHVLGWSVVTSVLVLPAAILAGYQFPLLIALLGRARSDIGRHIGITYACNTAGSIVGALSGGFLLPALGALGAWRFSVWLLVGLGASALCLEFAGPRRPGDTRPWWSRHGWALVPAALAVLAVSLLDGATGPTALWRHSPIGAGREDSLLSNTTRNKLHAVINEKRRGVSREWDGRESTVGLYTLNDTAFLNNGKSDGAAVMDSGTQVMGGLLGAMLHPGVSSALVIGLGTGSSAGWIGSIDSVERVDVVELEPAIQEVARICSPVNRAVLDNPKVHVQIGDAREVLLTTPRRYDLVFSEPSNPYRAGVASLFTEEFYRAARQRLRPGGVFAQWVQAYEIDGESIRTIYATLSRVFGSVESWRSKESDLILVARVKGEPLDVSALRTRIASEPWKSALFDAWRIDSVEGVLAHFVARPSLARDIAARVGDSRINTDDHTVLEFAFARAIGVRHEFEVGDIRRVADRRDELWPEITGGDIDWARVQDAVPWIWLSEWSAPRRPEGGAELDDAAKKRFEALDAWFGDRADDAIKAWDAQPRAPEAPLEILALADSYAVQGDARAEALVERVRALQPTEGLALDVRRHWALSRWDAAYDALTALVVAYRTDPWPSSFLLARVLPYGTELAKRKPEHIAELFDLLEPHFALDQLEYLRLSMRLDLGMLAAESDPSLCVAAIAEQSPFVPWERDFLLRRIDCYERADHPGLAAARADLAAYDADEPVPFGRDL